jgi:hypothetical protein
MKSRSPVQWNPARFDARAFAQAEAQLKDLEARVTAMVDNAMPMRGKGGHMGQGGRGGHMGKGGRGGHMGQGGRGWFGFGPGDAAPTATPSGQGG